MARKIICNLPNRENNEEPNCTGVVAHQISSRMIQIGRQGKQRISIVGKDWNNLTTCPKCKREHSIICTNGTIDEAPHTYEEITIEPNSSQTDPNDPNSPGSADQRTVTPDDPATPPPAPNPAPAPAAA